MNEKKQTNDADPRPLFFCFVIVAYIYYIYTNRRDKIKTYPSHIKLASHLHCAHIIFTSTRATTKNSETNSMKLMRVFFAVFSLSFPLEQRL